MKIRVLVVDGDWSDGLARLVQEFVHAGAEKAPELTAVDLAREVRAAEQAAAGEARGPAAASTYLLPVDLQAAAVEFRGAERGKAPAAEKRVAGKDGKPVLQGAGAGKPRPVMEAVKGEVLDLLRRKPLTSGQIIHELKSKGRVPAQIYAALKELRDTKSIETRNDENLEKRNFLLS